MKKVKLKWRYHKTSQGRILYAQYRDYLLEIWDNHIEIKKRNEVGFLWYHDTCCLNIHYAIQYVDSLYPPKKLSFRNSFATFYADFKASLSR